MRRLAWTRELIERFWHGCYALDLEAARAQGREARHVVAALRTRARAAARLVTLGDRDPSWLTTCLFAGFAVGRLDAGPLLRPCPTDLFQCENWLGTFEDPVACVAEIVLAPKILAHLLDEDVEPFFATVKSALKPRGMLAIVTRNAEMLDQFLAISPATGDAFHMEQRLRSFGASSLRALLVAHGFQVEAILQCQADEAGFACLTAPIDSLATKRELHFGNGDTLVVIARRALPVDG
jgi:hypothetical protein